jgi:hypothetical protein
MAVEAMKLSLISVDLNMREFGEVVGSSRSVAAFAIRRF